MAIFKGTVRMRRGPESEFDESKMVSGELAIATDKPVMWFCWENGKVEKIEGSVTPEKLREYFNEWCVDNPIFIDDTLAVKGKAADARATGDAISQLSEEIANLSGGAPTPVSVVADMTDTAKIYLYTGAEDGYIAGNWYYYDGTAWVSGGKYGETNTTEATSIEPENDDIPKVFFDEDIPQTKDDVITKFRYISKTQDIEGWAEFKAQGNSSMQYAKKNMTVKLYKDEALTKKLKIDFKEWGEQRKFCLKANWIDLSHSRNIVSARLWADIVKSRSNFADLPELYRTSPNLGAVDGFPIKVYSQGIYQGRYTWNIPKDAWMANMDDTLETHCILCGEGYTSGCFRDASMSQWTDEIHDTCPTLISERWLEIINFVMTSTNDEFKTNLSNYFDVDSLIDYYIYAVVQCGLDAFGKNQLYFTYDGLKWIAGMYDMDSTWGLWWTGAYFVDYDYPRTSFQDFQDGNGNLLYIRLETLFVDRIKERYAELRKRALSIPNVINHFERFIDIAPLDLVNEDYASTTGDGKFIGIPSKNTNNIQQIRAFAINRMEYCDTFFDSMVVPVYATGISLDQISVTISGSETVTLVATVTPEDCTENIYWTVDDSTVATVKDGVVTALKNGSCTITATVGSYSASCVVTVENIVVKHSITRNLVGCTSSSDAIVANDGDSYTETISASDGYVLDSATVTMGGVDITSTAYANGVVTITEVTGDIVISVTAVVSIDSTSLVYSLPETTSFDGTAENPIDTGFQVTENKSFTIAFVLDDYTVPDGYSALCCDGTSLQLGLISVDSTGINSRIFAWNAITFVDTSKFSFSDIAQLKGVLVYDADSAKISCKMSRNGVDVSNEKWGSGYVTWKAWSATLKIGAMARDVPSFAGTLSDFCIYERAFTESEINAYLGI